MKWNFLYQITAASRTRGLPSPDPRFLCPLSTNEFVEPAPSNKIPGYATGHSGQMLVATERLIIRRTLTSNLALKMTHAAT
jgi:hypothetical protein